MMCPRRERSPPFHIRGSQLFKSLAARPLPRAHHILRRTHLENSAQTLRSGRGVVCSDRLVRGERRQSRCNLQDDTRDHGRHGFHVTTVFTVEKGGPLRHQPQPGRHQRVGCAEHVSRRAFRSPASNSTTSIHVRPARRWVSAAKPPIVRGLQRCVHGRIITTTHDSYVAPHRV